MANFQSTGNPHKVSSLQDVINAILGFATQNPGPFWTEDGTWTAAGHLGELFLTNSAALGQQGYYYFNGSGSGSMLLAGIEAYPGAVGTGWGAASGPAPTWLNLTEGDPIGLGLYLNEGTLVTGEGDLWLFGSEDRLICCLKSNRQSVYTTLYIGNYTPHCAAGDDLYPFVSIGNSPGVFFLQDESLNGGLMASSPEVSEWQHAFPVGMLKRDAKDQRRYIRKSLTRFNPEDAFSETPSRTIHPPKNERAAIPEDFMYAQYIGFSESSKGESFTLDGMYRAPDDLNLEGTVTVGVDSYFVWPTAVQPDSSPRCMLIGPMGTAV